MKKTAIILLLLVVSLSPKGAYAHRMGLPIVRVNGEWAPTNPISNFIGNTDLTIAADLGPRTYVAGSPVSLGMNDAFQKAADGNNIEFKWDYGDKTPFGSGITTTHVYQRSGSFVVTVSFKYPNEESFYPSDNILLQILPSTGVKTPNAEIHINGEAVPNTQRRAIPFVSGEQVTFDASASKGDSLSYLWDYGDGKTGKGKRVTHAYSAKNSPTYFAILRVTDKNNISSDSAVFLTEGEPVKKTASSYFDQIVSYFRNLFSKK